MPLDDLNREIYRQNSDAADGERKHEQSVYDPTVSVGGKYSPFEDNEHWNRPQIGLSPEKKKKLWIGGITLLVVALAIGGFFLYRWWQEDAFHQDRVTISLEGLSEADSTQQMKYIIHYANNNRVTLRNAEIQLNYSENFQPVDNLNLKYLSPTASKIFIGDIKPKSSGTTELKGVFYAPKDTPVYLNAEINFVPSNGTANLSMKGDIGVNVTAAPVILEVSAPQQAVDGDGLEYVIDYKNIDIKRIGDVQVRVEFPQGFQISSSQPQASEKNNFWYVGNLEADQSGKIRIQGKINGNDNDGKNIIVSLGHIGTDKNFVVYSKQELTTRIVSSVLKISQTLEDKTGDIVSAGEILKYLITFQNTGDIGIRDAIVSVELNSKIMDFSKIDVKNGSYDASKNVITWKASGVPELANINPKASGLIRFSIPIKSVIPVESKFDKNFVISSIAKIDSIDIPTPLDSNKVIGSNNLKLKLASKVLFDVKGYYTDEKIKNSGPIPLETGRETTYAMHWSLINISNDLSDAKIVSALPVGVRWTGQVLPLNEKITFNERTNQILWEAGNIPAGTGVFDKAREVVFQIGVTPQTSQIGKEIDLINKSIFSAKDMFIEKSITIEGAPKNTQLFEDKTVGYINSKVVK